MFAYAYRRAVPTRSPLVPNVLSLLACEAETALRDIRPRFAVLGQFLDVRVSSFCQLTQIWRL